MLVFFKSDKMSKISGNSEDCILVLCDRCMLHFLFYESLMFSVLWYYGVCAAIGVIKRRRWWW